MICLLFEEAKPKTYHKDIRKKNHCNRSLMGKEIDFRSEKIGINEHRVFLLTLKISMDQSRRTCDLKRKPVCMCTYEDTNVSGTYLFPTHTRVCLSLSLSLSKTHTHTHTHSHETHSNSRTVTLNPYTLQVPMVTHTQTHTHTFTQGTLEFVFSDVEPLYVQVISSRELLSRCF